MHMIVALRQLQSDENVHLNMVFKRKVPEFLVESCTIKNYNCW